MGLLAGAFAAPQFLVGGHSGLVHAGGFARAGGLVHAGGLAHAGGLVHAGGLAHAGGLVHAGPVLHAAPLVHSIARPVAVAGAYAAADPLAEVSPYTFNYAVSDDYSASSFTASEGSDGLGTKTGSYSVALPDGRTQTVNYSTNDVDGYVADVAYDGVPQYPPVAAPLAVAHPTIVSRPALAVAHPAGLLAHPAGLLAHPAGLLRHPATTIIG